MDDETEGTGRYECAHVTAQRNRAEIGMADDAEVAEASRRHRSERECGYRGAPPHGISGDAP